MDDTISKLAVIQIIEKMRARIGHNLERSVGRAMIEILDEVGEDVGKLPSALGTNLAEDGTDLISRAAAQTELQLSARRYTVAHEAHGEGRVVWSEDLISVSDAMDVLRKIPPAQPEIIRCRECKFASGDSRICMKFGHSPIGELDFCAWAERRTDE